MRFDPTEDQRLVVGGVAKLARSLRASAARRDAEGAPDPAALAAMRSLGAFGLLVPESANGLAVDAATWVLALQEIAAADAGLALGVAEHGLAARLIAVCGDLPLAKAAAEGRALGCISLAGPHNHLDDDSPGLAATLTDGAWQLSGATGWAALTLRAEFAIVRARPAGALLHVALAGTGVVRSRLDRQLGLRASAGGAMQFDGAAARLLPCNADAEVANLRAWLALSIAAISVGVARAAAVAAGRYADERIQFGAPISRLQPVQWHVANSALDIDSAALLVGRAAALVDRDGAAPRPLTPATTAAIWQAKAAAGTAAVQVSDRAIQIHGGYGYTRDFPVERAYRDATLLQVLHGTPSAVKVRTAQWLASQAA
ncbi:MAG: acyl-CoA dehydrogenase family protein [Deltaproteobacteria bacterium]|nr:acyl-CoA dehydrogenase family protein [Deltaproteobacteria bacterium]